MIVGLIYFNKDKIVKKLVEDFEQKSNTRIEYSSSRLDIDGSFPNILISVEDLKISPVSDSTLAYFKEINLGANPIQIIKSGKNINLNKISFYQPEINLSTNVDGVSNWSTIKYSDDQSEGSYDIAVKNLIIEQGSVVYENDQEQSKYELHEINYNGKLNLNDQNITQESKMSTSLSAKNDILSINKYELRSDFTSIYNLQSEAVQIPSGSFSINRLEFELNGNIQELSGSPSYALELNSIDQDFSNLLSMVQNLRQIPVDDFKASGNFSVNAKVNGHLEKNNAIPNYSVYVDTDNGSFYLPEDPVNELTIDLSVRAKNDNKKVYFSELHIDEFNLARNDESISGTADIENDGKRLSVLYDIDSRIDDLKNFNGLSQYNLLGGKIHLLSDGDFIISDGVLDLQSEANFNIDWEAENIDLKIDSMRFYSSVSEGLGNQDGVTITFGRTSAGMSDAKGDLILKNPLSLLEDNKKTELITTLDGELLDLNELLKSSNDKESIDSLSSDFSWLEKLDIQANYEVKELRYKGITLSNSTLEGKLINDGLEIKKAATLLHDSPVQIIGNLNGLSSYLQNSGPLLGTLDISAQQLDAERLETEYLDPRYIDQDSSGNTYFNNLDLKIVGDAEVLKYNDFRIQDNLMSFNLEPNRLIINDILSNSFGGSLNLKGNVSFSKNRTKAEIKSDISNVSISESLSSLPFLNKIAYPLSFIDGRINSTLSLSSAVDEKYNLILSEINAFALLETLRGSISGFEPLEKLSNILGITQSEKDAIEIKESKNWVTIQDGWVKVEEFEFTIGKTRFKVEGAHSLQNVLDYNIFAEVPSEQLNRVGDLGVIDGDIIAKLNKYKVSKQGYVGLFFDMTGNMNNPILKLNEIDVISAGKAVVEQTIQEVKDSITTVVDDLKTDINQQVKDSVAVYTDKGKDIADEVLDSVKKQSEEILASKIDSNITSAIDSIIPGGFLDSLPPIDSLKKEIFKLKNIFGKKNSE